MKHIRLIFLTSVLMSGVFTYVCGNNTGQGAILLIHGLAGASSTWDELVQEMQNSPYQYVSNYKVIKGNEQKQIIQTKRYLIQGADKTLAFTLDFSDNQNISFDEQGDEVDLVLKQIRDDYHVGQILLIGHSMGGLAARSYINNYGSVGIAGLITVTSPNLGSYLGYMRDLYFHCNGIAPLLNTMIQFFSSVYFLQRSDLCDGFEMVNILSKLMVGLDINSKAVDYLTPDSDEMIELNSHPFPTGLPVVNIISKWETNKILDDQKKKILTDITRFIQSRYSPGDSKISYFSDALNATFNDGIVPVSSQYMKLAVPNGNDLKINTYIVSSFHTDSPKETATIFSAINSILSTGSSQNQVRRNIVFILDSSGSMKESDPDNIRLNALASLAGEMELFDNVLIFDFDSNVSWINSDNYSQSNKNRLRNEIMAIDADGGTNIGQAFRFTSEILQQTGLVENTTVVLLTDGMGDYSGEVKWFTDKKIPVFTISLMDNINEILLNSIAKETNGIYFKAHSEFDIIDAYYSITSKLSSRAIICKSRSKGHGIIQKRFTIEPGASLLKVSLFSNNAISNVSITSPGSATSLPHKNTEKETAYYFGTDVENPTPGIWTISYMIKGETQILSSESQLMVSVKAIPIVLYSARSLDNNSIQLIETETSNIESVKIASRNVSVLTPLNKIIKVETRPGEGINFHPIDGAGTYKFDLQLYGTINNQPFERFYTFSVLNSSSDQKNAPKLIAMLGNTADIETNSAKSNIGDEYHFYCIESTNERLIAKGIVTIASQNTCTVELTETFSSGCRNGQIIPVLYKANGKF